MKKTAILLTALIGVAPAFSQCDQNNIVELNKGIGFGENVISFEGKTATIKDHMDSNPNFNKVDMWYCNQNIEHLGTIESPEYTSLLDDRAPIYTLLKEQPERKRIIWNEKQNVFMLLEETLPAQRFAEYKAMLVRYEQIEQEYQKTLP